MLFLTRPRRGRGVNAMAPNAGGKTTVIEEIRKELPNFTYLSMGGLIADIRNGKLESKVSRERALTTVAGNLLTDEEVITIFEEQLARLPDSQDFILDGVARSSVQIDYLLERFSLLSVLFLETNLDECRRRALRKPDHERRPDDTPEGIDRRHELYLKVTRPSIDYARVLGRTGQLRFARVDGNATKAEVCRQVERVLPFLLGESGDHRAAFPG